MSVNMIFWVLFASDCPRGSAKGNRYQAGAISTRRNARTPSPPEQLHPSLIFSLAIVIPCYGSFRINPKKSSKFSIKNIN